MIKLLKNFKNEPIVNPWDKPDESKKLLSGIEEARRFLKQSHSVLIGDQWVTGDDGEFFNVNPNNREEKFGPFTISSPAQTARALEHAKKIQPDWGKLSFKKRSEALKKISAEMVRQKWVILGLLMLEAGKTGLESYADWAEGVDFLEYYALSCELIHDPAFLALTPLDRHATSLNPKPIGIGVSLPPFNFPFAIFAGMWAAPTVMGNVMIVKPSPRAPASGLFVTKIIHDLGLPIQLVLDGPNSNRAGEFLVGHPDIALITFTGSHKAGWAINKAAAMTSEKWIKRVVAEMGGCDFIAVHDTKDINALVDAVQNSALGFQGQKCSALSRLIIKEDLYDTVKKAVIERLGQITPQDVTKPSTIFGGVINQRAFDDILSQCATVQNAGAHFLLGAKAAPGFAGFGILPSVHEGLDPFQKEAGMEIFGPIFGIYRAKNFDEMVKIANATPYALTGAFFTEKPELKKRAGEFTSGNTYINRKCTGAYVGAEPFGGWYGSGTDDKAGHWSHLLRFIQWQTISEKIV